MASVAQLVARKSHNLKVPGSIPGGGIFALSLHFATSTYCSRANQHSRLHVASVAQTVERQPFKLLAVGSIPTGGVLLFSYLRHTGTCRLLTLVIEKFT